MKIAVLDDWAGCASAMAEWSELPAEIQFFQEKIPDDQLSFTLRPFDVLCVMRERTPISADLIRNLPHLKLIVTTGPRNLSIDLAAARDRGVTVCGTQSRKTTTAELTLTLILWQSRAIGANCVALQAGGFQAVIGRDMANLRIGLIGLGQVGQQVAGLAQAFGARVSAWSPNLTQARAAAAKVDFAADPRTLAAGSDVLSVHMVLSDRTVGLVGADLFEALPRDALFINTSRAGLVQRTALFDWLEANTQASAAVDVFEAEPLPLDDPWRSAEQRFGQRLLLTPHLGYATTATFRLFYSQTIEAITGWIAGTPIRVIEG